MKRWPTKPLIEVCSPKQWPTVSTAELTKTGFPVYGANGLIGHYHSYNHDEPTILITCRGATCGTLNISPPRAYVTGNAMALDNPRLDIIDFRFFYYALLERGLGDTINGAAQPQITRASLSRVSVPVPPLMAQKWIVELMDEADELRKLRSQADRRTADLIPALFHGMFGDPVENSNGWPCVQLIGLCGSADDIKCGPFGTQLSKSEYMKKGVPLWGIKNVNALFELPTQEFLTPSTAQRLIQYSIEPCDIVMTRKGTVGNCAVYPERFPLGIMHSDLLRLRVSREKCEPVFLAHQLHYSRDVERQLAQISGGAVMPGINVTKLKSLKVLAPPLPLQKEFASRVSDIRALQTEQDASRRRLEHLFQSLLHGAFRGKL